MNLVVTHVPAGVGTRVGGFAYEWEDVGFRSRVWGRGPDADGAFGVDLPVEVLRGDRLADVAATRAFLAEYHEQDPAGRLPFDHDGRPGWARPDAVFRQAGPGSRWRCRSTAPGSERQSWPPSRRASGHRVPIHGRA